VKNDFYFDSSGNFGYFCLSAPESTTHCSFSPPARTAPALQIS
jgi:hypothetical protein